jgi:rare lipoprotein A
MVPVVQAKPPIVRERAAPVKPAASAAKAGGFYVQVGAFSNRASALAVAKRAGGNAVQAGRLWRVRIGAHAGREEADAALAKARRAGYADARILSDN